MPDGVWVERGGEVEFMALPPPGDEEVRRVCSTAARRVVRLLRRRGLLEGEEDQGPADLLGSLQAKAILAALALHPSAGPGPGAEFSQKGRCASTEGFSVHADVALQANDRQGLERLCRYIARPSLSLERLRRLPDGRVGYRLKRLIGETGEIVLGPSEFVARLVTLVPPPRAHLMRYHGVFAPNARLRPRVVPLPAPEKDAPAEAPRPRSRLDWAGLLRRTYAVDVLQCDRCPGLMTVLAYLTERAVVRRILEHLGLPADPPPRGPPPGRLIVDVREVEVVDAAMGDHLPAWMRAAPRPGPGDLVPQLRWDEGVDEPVDVARLPAWMRQAPIGLHRDEPTPRWEDGVDEPVELARLPLWMRQAPARPRAPEASGGPAWDEALDEPVDLARLPAWMRPSASPVSDEGEPAPAWAPGVEAEVDVSALPAWMRAPSPRPAPVDPPAWREDEREGQVDPSRLPAWMRPPLPRAEREHVDPPGPDEQAPPPGWGDEIEARVDPRRLPGWMRGAATRPPEVGVARSYDDGESVVDLVRLPTWMTSQGYLPIAPTLNPRSRPAHRGGWQSTARVRPSRRLDEPPVDPECQAELPDETPDPRLLPAWMRQPAPRPALPARPELPSHWQPGVEDVDPPALFEHVELDAALPGWLLMPSRPAPPHPQQGSAAKWIAASRAHTVACINTGPCEVVTDGQEGSPARTNQQVDPQQARGQGG